VVANPEQVASLLQAVGEVGRRGERLVAFFGCLYYAGMRPSEAADIAEADCHLPPAG
jgi:site-specific recombinase XerD